MKHLFRLVFVLCFMTAFSHGLHAGSDVTETKWNEEMRAERHRVTLIYFTNYERPNRFFNLFKKKWFHREKLTAAILAFPFPFGMVALHRIHLGCKPYVPVIYIATVGGVFGLIPLIDFFIILSKKDLEQFKNNPNVIMWAD